MPRIWNRVKAEISAQHPDGRGRELAWLAGKLGVSLQTINNWTTRDIPASRHQAVAKVLGWTVDQLIGNTAPASPAWPFPMLSRQQFDAWKLTPPETAVVEMHLRQGLDAVAQMRATDAQFRKRTAA